jgi:polysaccharide pyruvyl transferase WcaK-like protein
MKVLFTSCWQSGNTGDNAIWKSMASHLKKEFQDLSLTICSQKTEKWDVDQLQEVVNTTVIPVTLVNNIKTEDIRKLNNERIIEKYLQSKAEFAVDALKNADVVISQGGGYMTKEAMLTPLVYMYIAQYLGKPTFFASQTFVRGVSYQTNLIARMVFSRAKLIVARELESYKFITEAVGVKGENIKMLPDGVFTVKPKKYNKPIPKNAIKIGIRGYLATPSFLKEVAHFADMAIEAFGNVLFIPVGHGAERNDIEQAKRVMAMMRHKAHIVEDRVDAGELLDIMKDGIVVSDRYHGIVCSASACTPFVPLTPDIDYKMPGLLDTISYPYKEVLPVKTVRAQEMFNYALKVWKNREVIRSSLNKTIPEVKRKSEQVYEYIIQKINEDL